MYSRILSVKTANAFTGGKTSDEYRKERFATVLETFHIETTPEYLDELAAEYRSSLEQGLQLKPGASSLLSYLASIDKKILIISEGPQDAQEWTFAELQIQHHFLATTDFFEVSKVDGLFKKVLGRLEIDPSDLVFIGDNRERDVEPALKCGILAIRYSEQENTYRSSEHPRVQSLSELESFLRGLLPELPAMNGGFSHYAHRFL